MFLDETNISIENPISITHYLSQGFPSHKISTAYDKYFTYLQGDKYLIECTYAFIHIRAIAL